MANPQGTSQTIEMFGRIREKVETIDDLEKYARAVRLLPKAPTRAAKFWESEAFYKFMGGGIGAIVAVAILLTSQMLSIAKTGLEVSELTRDRLEKINRELVGDASTLTTEISDLRTQISASLNRTTLLDTRIGELDAEKALRENELAALTQALQAKDKALDGLNAEIELAQANLAQETLSGVVLASCDPGFIAPIYGRISQMRKSDPNILNPRGLSLRLFLIQGGELFYVLREERGERSQIRTGGGVWSILGEKVVLRLLENNSIIWGTEFAKSALMDFAAKKVPQEIINRPTIPDEDGKTFHASRCRPRAS